MRTFDAYFYNGGFPELIAFKDKRSWLSGLYQKIFFGDLVARYALRNSDSMSLLVKKLAESVMQPSSYNRLKNIVSSAGESVGVRTVIDYVGYLEETWLIFRDDLFQQVIDRYYQGKVDETTKRKLEK